MVAFLPVQDRPDVGDAGVLLIGEKGAVLDRWTSYRWTSDFLEVCDDFEFTLEADTVPRMFLDLLTPGTKCALQIGRALQATGYIDEVVFRNARSGGTELHVRGRDALAPVVDGCIDPTMSFSKDATLERFLTTIFVDTFGFSLIVDDNAANRGVLKGVRGTKTTKKGKPLKSFALHQLKPYPSEGAFAFAARVAQRHGIWLWASADGSSVIAAQPDFEQDASYRLTRTLDGANTVIDGGVSRNGRDQPSAIIATGFGGGGNFEHTNLKAAMVNELTGLDDDGFPIPFVQAALNRHKSARLVNDTAQGTGLYGNFSKSMRMARSMPRVLYLHDDESKTPEQLEAYVRREMSLRQRHAVVGEYTVAGHAQNGAAWSVDTIVDVDDERAHFSGPMWILRRTFEKSRSVGTMTHLTTILPGTLTF